MKYLKQFEGYGNESNFYEEITDEQWDQVEEDGKWEDIDSRSVTKLKSVLEDLSKMNPKYKKIEYSKVENGAYQIAYVYDYLQYVDNSTSEEYDEILMGLADDDWWYVYLNYFTWRTSKSGVKYIQGNRQYYKCDQMEGIFKLLKDKELMR